MVVVVIAGLKSMCRLEIFVTNGLIWSIKEKFNLSDCERDLNAKYGFAFFSA